MSRTLSRESTKALLKLENLQTFYGEFEALAGLSLELGQGSIGLLGPNGAGKSTLIKTLLGLKPHTRGSAQVLGWSLPGQAAQVRQATGYMPENDCYLPHMSAVHYVSFGGQLVGMPRAAAFRRAHEVLHYVGLGEARYRKLAGFSTGMKQRVKLAQALVHGPKLVFLDEPTNGLDPKGRDEMLALIEDVKARGVNVVLSSHLLADVERVCEGVIMMNRGELLYHGSIEAFTTQSSQQLEVRAHTGAQALAEALEAQGFEVSQASGQRLMVKAQLSAKTRAKVLATAHEVGAQLREFKAAKLTLEEAFLGLIRQGERAAGKGGELGDS